MSRLPPSSNGAVRCYPGWRAQWTGTGTVLSNRRKSDGVDLGAGQPLHSADVRNEMGTAPGNVFEDHAYYRRRRWSISRHGSTTRRYSGARRGATRSVSWGTPDTRGRDPYRLRERHERVDRVKGRTAPGATGRPIRNTSREPGAEPEAFQHSFLTKSLPASRRGMIVVTITSTRHSVLLWDHEFGETNRMAVMFQFTAAILCAGRPALGSAVKLAWEHLDSVGLVTA